MTKEEMERAIEFLLDQQARFSTDMDILKDSQARLTDDVQTLTRNVNEMREQAALDRQEMREGINRMITIAEAMQSNIILLTQAQQGTSHRVGNLEKRVETLEQRQPPTLP